MGYLLPCSVQGHLGGIRLTHLKMTRSSNMVHKKMKRVYISEAQRLLIPEYLWGVCDIVLLKAILASFDICLL